MARKTSERQPLVQAVAQTPVAGWLRGIRLSGFSLVMMGILVLAVVVIAPNLRTYVAQRQEINQLNAAVTDQQATVDRLKSERERYNDRTFITTQARDRLSYVLPGDISFLVINDLPLPVATGADAAPVSSDIQHTNVDWISSMFASVMTAGLAPQAVSK